MPSRKSIQNRLFFVSKKPIYNSDKIVLKQYSDMFNIGFV